MIKITKEQAKNFLASYHNLNHCREMSGKSGVLAYFERVGNIQFDPLNVVGRNADLVLQARVEGYSSKLLHELLYQDRLLVDGWDKQMAIYRREDWPKFSRVRKGKMQEAIAILRHRDSLGALDYIEDVRGVIRSDGPLQSNQISMGERKAGRWGHKKLSSATLDYMFQAGELGIYEKRNTQKVYDLIENLLPPEFCAPEDPFPSERAFYEWYFARRVGSLGLIWGKNGGGWLGHFVNDKKLRNEIMAALVDEDVLQEVSIRGIEELFYVRTQDIPYFEETRQPETGCFLAPLDNLLWDRDMIEAIYGFRYSWEVYTPVSKRRYGYYVLPVMAGNELVARFEPEMYRGGTLVVKNWWWEPRVKRSTLMDSVVDEAFRRFSEYLGVEAPARPVDWKRAVVQ